MLYAIGTHYDFKTGQFTHPSDSKTETQETKNCYPIGTRLRFFLVNNEWRVARMVPVTFATA